LCVNVTLPLALPRAPSEPARLPIGPGAQPLLEPSEEREVRRLKYETRIRLGL
jgi:hypothetical protein